MTSTFSFAFTAFFDTFYSLPSLEHLEGCFKFQLATGSIRRTKPPSVYSYSKHVQKLNKIYKIYNIHLSPWYQFTCAQIGNWWPHAIFQKPQASKDNIYAVTRHGHKHLRPSSSSSTSSICSHHTLQSHHPKCTPSSTINLPSPWHIGTFRQGCGELPASFLRPSRLGLHRRRCARRVRRGRHAGVAEAWFAWKIQHRLKHHNPNRLMVDDHKFEAFLGLSV